VAQGVTFTTPAGGESWLPGRPITITYKFWTDMEYHSLTLCRDKVRVGWILSTTIPLPAGQIGTKAWQVGHVWEQVEPGGDIWVPSGEYTIGVGTVPGAEPKYFSEPFTILDLSPFFTRYNKIYYSHLPTPGDCPECLILDLPGLHEEMVNSEYAMAAGLYFKGKLVANMGKFGKGQGFPAKLQIKLEPGALAAVKGGEEFELRLFDGAGKQIHSQRTQLVLLPGSEAAMAMPFFLIPDPQPNTNPPPNYPAPINGSNGKPTPGTFDSLRFTGWVNLYPAGNTIAMGVDVHQHKQPVPNLLVKVMNNLAPGNPNHPEKYYCYIQNFTTLPGSTISVTFDRFPNIPNIVGSNRLFQPQLTAKATVGGLTTITAPLPDAHVVVTTPGFLNVEWAGGNPPYRVIIVALPDSGPTSTVLQQTGIAGTSLSVPLAIFHPGVKHLVSVYAKMADFAFSANVDPASYFSLDQTALIYFYTE
jgi:hypothetical protein